MYAVYVQGTHKQNNFMITVIIYESELLFFETLYGKATLLGNYFNWSQNND